MNLDEDCKQNPVTVTLTEEQRQLLAGLAGPVPASLHAGTVLSSGPDALTPAPQNFPGFEVIPAGQGQSHSPKN